MSRSAPQSFARGWPVANSEEWTTITINNLVEKLTHVREKPEEIQAKSALAARLVTNTYIWDRVVGKMVNNVIEPTNSNSAEVVCIRM